MTVNPAIASVGDTVNVCDSSLTGVTAVTVGGVSATFTTSGTCVKLVVPVTSGGPIVVTTGGGPVTFSFSIIPVPALQATQIVT
jgi:hypothetical protein